MTPKPIASWEEHRAALERIEQLKDMDKVEADQELETWANFVESRERKTGEG